MRKAFSLFTPLVGTSVIVIAILISAVMVQNDIRLSRGLTSSYEQTNQIIASKAIKAAAGLQMLQNMETQTDVVITSGLVAACSSSNIGPNINSCEDKIIKGYFTDKNSVLRSQLIAGSGGLYDGVVESIKTVSSYEPVTSLCAITCGTVPPCGAVYCDPMLDISDRFDCCLSMALSVADPNAVTVTLEPFPLGSGKVVTTIKSSFLTPVIDGFSVDFKDIKTGTDKITLSIVPNDFSSSSNTNIRNMIQYTTDSVTYLKNNAGSVDFLTFPTSAIRNTACGKLGWRHAHITFTPTGLATSTLTVEVDWFPVKLSTGLDGTMKITYYVTNVPSAATAIGTC